MDQPLISRRAFSTLLAVALVTSTSLPGLAPAMASKGANLQVSAVVQPAIVVSTPISVSVPSIPIVIQASDIQRGFIQIATGSLLSLNAGGIRPTIVMEVALGDGAFRSFEIRSQEELQIASQMLFGDLNSALAGNLDALPATASGSLADSPLLLRFNFTDKVRPGPVSVPVTLDVSL